MIASIISAIFLWAIFMQISTDCLRINDRWTNDQNEMFSILAKFGFQKTDSFHLNRSRGYIFGNITSNLKNEETNNNDNIARSTLVLANRPHFRQMYNIYNKNSDNKNEFQSKQSSCAELMSVIDGFAFDSKCFKENNQDVLRRVPCPKNKLCDEEDDPSMVFPGYQLTYRVQDKAQARFWFLLVVDCFLDANCNWTKVNGTVDLSYDIWLVNGHPFDHGRYNPFEYQFSCEQQDLFEIMATAFLVNLILVCLQCRSTRMKRNNRSLYLLLIVCFILVELLLTLFDLVVFSFNGRGFPWMRRLSSIMRHFVDALLILLLILLAKGWTIRSNVVKQRSKTLFTWNCFVLLHLIFYFWAVSSADELQEMYIFDTWPGWGILFVRILIMGWFLMELRYSVRQVDEQKQTFFLHFGSGFLVWFVYLPILGALSSQIPVMYRYKVTTSLCYLANFVACSILIHLFYPRSTNRLYFLGSTAIGEEFSDEYEKAIIMDDLDSVDDISDKTTASDQRNGGIST